MVASVLQENVHDEAFFKKSYGLEHKCAKIVTCEGVYLLVKLRSEVAIQTFQNKF